MLSGGRHQGTCLRTSELGLQVPESPGEEAAVKGSGSSHQVSDTEREREMKGPPRRFCLTPASSRGGHSVSGGSSHTHGHSPHGGSCRHPVVSSDFILSAMASLNVKITVAL